MTFLRRLKRRGANKYILAALLSVLSLFLAAQEAPGGSETAVKTETAAETKTEAEPSAASGERSSQRAREAAETRTDRHRREITEEASSQLFNMNIWDKDVAFYMGGYWKGSLSANWGLANTPLGTAPDSEDSPLLFTQEADLTLSLWIWQKWFLEVSFIDNYDLNTYRAGYQGFPGETVQYVGVGNTGLDFPVFPYLDLGGDSPSSLGAYGRFGSGELNFHTLVRYDAAAREERIFVGNRERSFSTLVPDKPLRGRSFVLPDAPTGSIPVVYLEDKNGPLSGGGRRWRLAVPSEYAVSAQYGTVEFVREHPGMIAVSYAGGYSLGDYISNPGFLLDVQNHFDSTRTVIKLEDYPQPGGGSGAPAIITIGVPALVIWEPGTFSPFERQSRYAAPSNTTEDAALIRLGSGERLSGYEVLAAETLSMDIGLYTLTGDTTNRAVFEVVVSGGGGNRRSPETLWPLANGPGGIDYPELYLPGSPPFTDDIRLRFTNYGAAGAYTIGTDVVPGSVQVYRGGIMDSQVRYDSGSGTVTLSSPVGFNETIRVTYLKRSQERRLGSLAAGLGFVYKPEEGPLSAEAALGLRWNVSREAYTEEGASSPGTVGLGAKTSWDYDRLKLSLSLGLGFEQPDTTGLYRAAGMEGRSEIILGVSTTAGFISETPAQAGPFTALPPPFNGSFSLTTSNRVSLIYRNYRKTNILGGSELGSIDGSAPVVSGLSGPYPARDPQINTDVFVAEFAGLGPNEWTGFQVPLGRDGELLEQARSIVVPIRFYTGSPSGLLVIAQFGILAEEGSGGAENFTHIVEAPVYYGGTDYPVIELTDDMRRKLQSASQMRILIIDTGGGASSNRLLVGKPLVMGSAWRAVTVNGGAIQAAPDTGTATVKTAEVRAADLDNDKIRRLHDSGTNHVLQVEWDGVQSAGADGRTSAAPLSNYRVLSFFFKGGNAAVPVPGIPAGSTFRFIVARGPEAYANPGRRALDLKVTPPGPPWFNDGTWHSVEIHYGAERQRLLVDGAEFPAVINYRPEALRDSAAGLDDFAGSGQSAYMAALFEDTVSSTGTFYIDEICLEDPAPSYRVNGGATLDWRHPEALLSAGDRAILSGAAFNTALESAARGDPFNSRAESFTGFQSRSRGEISLLDTRLTGNLNFMVSSDVSYWSAGHGISRSFGPLSISETFNTAPPPNDETMNHQISLSLSTPLSVHVSSLMAYQNRRLNRGWNAAAALRAKQNGRPGFSLEGSLGYLERTEEPLLWMNSYAQSWTQSWTALLPDDGSSDGAAAGRGIQNRSARGRAGFTVDLLPVGADLSFEGRSAVSVPLKRTQSGSTARADFPFTLGRLRGNLRSQRDISRTLGDLETTVAGDMFHYGTSLSETAPLWRTVPVFALFDPGLDDAMDDARSYRYYAESGENLRFQEILGLNLLFPERYDALSLVIPVSHFTQLDRTMDQRLDTRLDVLTVSSGFGFSSINLFGAMGSHPVFSVYRNDEFRHSVSGVFSFPRNEDPLWRLQAEQSLGVYGFKGAELGITNTWTLMSGGWIESFGLLWTIPRDKSLLSAVYEAGMSRLEGQGSFPALSELAASEYERLFRESLEFVIDKSGTQSGVSGGVITAQAGHESVVRILGRLTLTGFVKLGFRRDVQAELVGLLLSFGTTLNVSF